MDDKILLKQVRENPMVLEEYKRAKHRSNKYSCEKEWYSNKICCRAIL